MRKPASLSSRVDRGGAAHALAQQAQRLAVEGARHAVDDEAGRVAGLHGRLAQARARRHSAATAGSVAAPGDHLDQGHGGRGVEEVQANHALGLAGGRGHGRDGERRGVGGQDGVGAAEAVQGGE